MTKAMLGENLALRPFYILCLDCTNYYNTEYHSFFFQGKAVSWTDECCKSKKQHIGELLRSSCACQVGANITALEKLSCRKVWVNYFVMFRRVLQSLAMSLPRCGRRYGLQRMQSYWSGVVQQCFFVCQVQYVLYRKALRQKNSLAFIRHDMSHSIHYIRNDILNAFFFLLWQGFLFSFLAFITLLDAIMAFVSGPHFTNAWHSTNSRNH